MGRKNNDGTLDFETDPFKAGRVPHPFAVCAFFDKNDYAMLWESDSKTDFLDRTINMLHRMPECTLYAHNGGRFDFHYLLEYARGKILVRNGRVSQMQIANVTLKDSFPLMPFALEEFRKTPIDYAIFERNRRDAARNRPRIESYLLDDCSDLHELITGFRETVGEKDTIGAAAFYQMRQLGIEIQSLNETHDDMFRPFFFGGRVQAFEKGILNGPLKYFDINSAYPDAMRVNHPHGSDYVHSRRLPAISKLGPCFVRCVARSDGALPMRDADGNLSFPKITAEFCATGWEIASGLRTGTIQIESVIDVWRPLTFINHAPYVDKFFALRTLAKKANDPIKRLAYKYLLNSGYGKYAQNPRDFREYTLAKFGINVPGFSWENDYGDISLWSKPNYTERGFYDVATGASITGYVRAKLWEAICSSHRVVYVDTDSMICESSRVPQGSALGLWKLEGDGAYVKRAAIAGKKLYGVEWSQLVDGKRHKIATKGARLSWANLLEICRGNEIIWENDAPTFSINGAHFVRRRINAT